MRSSKSFIHLQEIVSVKLKQISLIKIWMNTEFFILAWRRDSVFYLQTTKIQLIQPESSENTFKVLHSRNLLFFDFESQNQLPLLICGSRAGFDDLFYFIDDFWGPRWVLSNIKIATDSWNLPLQDLIHHVSRSGIVGYYTVMPCHHMVNKSFVSHNR